jgi:hypothetical protein
MKLIWHVTKKDLRRLAGPLAGLVLVELIKVGIGLALRSGNGADLGWFNRMALYLNLARGAEVLVTFVLVALLVHEDALVGARVFWRTRPISSGMLLRSKLLTGSLIFGVLPIAIALPWWAICGYGLANIGTAALEMLGWTICVVVPASALAVLADNLGRYISLTVVGYALGTFSLLMGIAYLPGQEPVTWGVLQSRSMISLALILVGWVVIIAWQFRRRSVGLPYGILIFLVIVVPLVMWGWSSDIFAAWRPDVKDSSERTRGINLTPGRARIDYFEGSAKTLDVPLRAEGVPPGRVLASVAADLSWRSRSGLLYAAGNDTGAYGYVGSNSTVTVRAMLDLAKVAPDEETARWQEEKRLELRKKIPQLPVAAEPRLSPEEAGKVLPMRFRLQGTGMFEPPTMKTGPEMRTDVVFARPQKLMELPLQPSAWMKIDGRSLRITQVRSVKHPAAGNGLAAAFIEKKVDFVSTQPGGGMDSAPLALVSRRRAQGAGAGMLVG